MGCVFRRTPAGLSIIAILATFAFVFVLPARAEEGWEQLRAEALPAEWAEFRERVGSRPWVVADFVEERVFSFRGRPTELGGTVWFGREEGLTLFYSEPREEVVRVDGTGVRVIEGNGRGRQRAIPERGRDVPAALLSMFRLDFAELEKTFEIRGQREEESWTLRLTPHDQNQAPIARIEVGGVGDQIRRIVIEQAARRRIELALSNVVYPESIDADTLSQIFP